MECSHASHFREEELEELRNERLRYKLDLVAVQECRWTGQGLIVNDDSVFLYSGRPEGEEHSRGVGVLLSKRLEKALINWEPINERLIGLKFNTRARRMIIVNAYAPTEAQQSDVKDDFYEHLNSWLNNNTGSADIILVLGDFNAKIWLGQSQPGEAYGEAWPRTKK